MCPLLSRTDRVPRGALIHTIRYERCAGRSTVRVPTVTHQLVRSGVLDFELRVCTHLVPSAMARARRLATAHGVAVLLLASLSACALGDTSAVQAAGARPKLRSRQQQRSALLVSGELPQATLVAALSRKEEDARAQDLAAAAWVGGLALASEVMQFVNTAAVIFAFQRLTGATSALQLVDAMTDLFTRLGPAAYPAYATLLICISVLPLMSALLFIFVAGMLFGPVKGTMLVSTSLSSSALIAYWLAKLAAEKKDFTLETLSPRAARIDEAIGTRPLQARATVVPPSALPPRPPLPLHLPLPQLRPRPLRLPHVPRPRLAPHTVQSCPRSRHHSRRRPSCC